MSWRFAKSILILPGNVLAVVPALILWVGTGTRWGGAIWSSTGPLFWCGLVFGAAGLVLMIWTVRLFRATGDGTPAPWDPVRTLVVTGPYRHVRNPMITGVILFLICETLVFRSWGLALWLALFFTANQIYLPLREEPELERRYGNAYRAYKQNVPRWLPRLTPWVESDQS